MSTLITLSNPDLWRRIESFEIDEGAPTLTFSARLARENGWTQEFAQRVVNEYRRFVYLAMVAGHRVTPSEHVDQAWHLHLTYTDSYWKRLCTHVLPRALEHTPTRGGDLEDDKFEDWYARTRESYEREFGSTPPRDIWPDGDTRFGHDLQWQRVNVADSWVIPKRTGRTAVTVLAMIVVGVIMLVLALTPSVSPNIRTIAVIVGAIMIVVLLVLGTAWSAINVRPSNRHADGGGCGGFMWLGGGCGSTNRDHTDGDHSGGDSGCSDGGGGGGGCGGGGCGGGCGG